MKTVFKIFIFSFSLLFVSKAAATPRGFTGSYSENFDGLTQSQTLSPIFGQQVALTGLTGWQGAKLNGEDQVSAMRLSYAVGSSGSGGLYSYGRTGYGAVSDRALGSVASSMFTPAFGVALKNTSPKAFSSVTISCNLEIWGSSSRTQNYLNFAYGLSPNNMLDSTFLTANTLTSVGALFVLGPDPVSTPGSKDGNIPANKKALSATIAFDWQPGATLYLRWTDYNELGTNAGLAIDDFKIVGVAVIPEPSACGGMLGGLAWLAALAKARSKTSAMCVK